MAVRIRFQAFDRNVKLLVDEALSKPSRQKLIAREAQKIIDAADEMNRKALGQTVPHDEWVDGRKNAPLDTVNPDKGMIRAEWQFINEAIDWVWERLLEASPYLTGRYSQSHTLFVDGREVTNPNQARVGREWVFASTVPYARKIERGLSEQAPDGVYEVVAAMAKARFGNVADIRFVWREIDAPGSMLEAWASGKDYSSLGRVGGARQALKDRRQPAILIKYR